MRILEENEINYTIDDILDAIADELGFSAIRSTDTIYYINITSDYQLVVDFEKDITIDLKLDRMELDLSDSTNEVDSLITVCESAIEITDIIKRMTGEEDNTE